MVEVWNLSFGQDAEAEDFEGEVCDDNTGEVWLWGITAECRNELMMLRLLLLTMMMMIKMMLLFLLMMTMGAYDHEESMQGVATSCRSWESWFQNGPQSFHLTKHLRDCHHQDMMMNIIIITKIWWWWSSSSLSHDDIFLCSPQSFHLTKHLRDCHHRDIMLNAMIWRWSFMKWLHEVLEQPPP